MVELYIHQEEKSGYHSVIGRFEVEKFSVENYSEDDLTLTINRNGEIKILIKYKRD